MMKLVKFARLEMKPSVVITQHCAATEPFGDKTTSPVSGLLQMESVAQAVTNIAYGPGIQLLSVPQALS